jgi:CHAT domain-containing protein/Tfp pilus assembly protein PilF
MKVGKPFRPRLHVRTAASCCVACLLTTIIFVKVDERRSSAAPPTDAQLAERDRLWGEAQKSRQQGKTSDAIEAAQRVAEIEEGRPGADAATLIVVWTFVAECAEAVEDWSAAENARDHALRIAKSAYAEKDWRTGEARRARELLTQLQKLSAEDRVALREAEAADARGVTLFRAGKPAEAVTFAKQVLETRERLLGPDHPRTATSLNNFALYKSRLKGSDAEVEPLYLRVLKIRETVLEPDHPHLAIILNNLAGLYKSLGNYAAAEPLYERALKIKEDALGTEHADTALTLNNLAALYKLQGNYAAAETLYERALRIKEKTLGPEHSGTAITLNDLAALYEEQGNFVAAEPLQKRALKIQEKTLRPGHPDTATTLNNLAAIYLSQGNYAAAEPLCERALKAQESEFGVDHPGNAVTLSILADLYYCQGKKTAAEPLFKRALAIREESLGPNHPDTAASLSILSSLYRNLGDLAQARSLARRAFDIQIAHLERSAAIQTEQQQFLMSARAYGYLSNWLRVTSDDSSEARDAWSRVLVWKGLTTTRQVALRRALKDDPTYAEFRRVSQLLGAVALSPPLPPSGLNEFLAWKKRAPDLRRTWNEQKTSLETELQQLEDELSRKSALFHQDHQRRAITPQDVVAALRQNLEPTALVDLIEYRHLGRTIPIEEQRLAAFVIRSDGKIHRVELGASKPIYDALKRWRNPDANLADRHDPAAELRRLLWKPLEPHLERMVTVLVSPDRELAQLPWNALPGAMAGKYLIEERLIAVVPVPQMLPELLREKPHNGPPSSLLVVGDIDYGGVRETTQDSAQADGVARLRDGRWQMSKLPSARSELTSIEKRYRDNTHAAEPLILEGSEATESRFCEEAPQHVWLHLITHGFFVAPDMRFSPAVSQDPSALSSEMVFPASTSAKLTPINPGLLSGLAFAGANAPPEPGKSDGILTALEVSALDLSRVDTVVLSACETGLGEVSGSEGLLGLQRSFQVAGARTVVCSLWRVHDAATSMLMQRFYENLWDKKLGKLESLREAQIWMLRQQGSRNPALAANQAGSSAPLPPFFWAPFFISGDWR